jgi:GAF domain-containing protein
MISLLDEERQHILAEATCDLPLQPDALGDASNTLWLGNVSIPRSWGICEKVLELGPNVEPILVISDLTTDQRSCFREDVQSNPDMRFYASVALKSPNGATVGTLCIFDNKSRDGLSKEQAELFKDLGSTAVNYLNTYTIRDQYRRGERFTRGLVSFAEGASALVPFEREVRQDSALPSQTSSDISSTTDKEIVSTDDAEKVHEGVELNETTPNHPLSAISKTARAKSARHRSIRSLRKQHLH